MFLSSAMLNGHDSGLPALITPLSKEQRCWFDFSIFHHPCKMANYCAGIHANSGCIPMCELLPKAWGRLCSVLALVVMVPHP